MSKAKSKTAAIIQARMSSSRLPGKVLLEAAGVPLLEVLVNRLKRVPSLDQVIVATTTSASDEPLVGFCRERNIPFFRGSEDDVLKRVLDAATDFDVDLIVEITGDCPLLDPEIVDQAVRTFERNATDYVSNVYDQSYPVGMDVQVYKRSLLADIERKTDHPLDREHVTRFIRKNIDKFRAIHMMAPARQHWPDLWLVLDEPADYELLRDIYSHFKKQGKETFLLEDMLHLLREVHPDWPERVAKVGRKGLDD